MQDQDIIIPEFSSTEKKKTLGEQVVEVHTKYAGEKTQEVRETTNAMGKGYMASLESLIKQNEREKEDYYIMEILKPDSLLPGVISLKHIARRSRPRPEWGIALYKISNSSGTCTYEWGLPHAAEALIMAQNPEGWERKTMDDIQAFIEGRLV